MCGIAGIVDPSLSALDIQARLVRMTDVITHRGPDDAGHVGGNACGIGMRRLSIIDVAGGQQPIANETGDIHVVCNGEIYNFVDLRSDLQTRGHAFKTSSDAEVIVHLYEELGDHCFTHLDGMFGIAIWDQRRDRVVVARDRLGQKPLFFAQRDKCFWFGSEMKSLLAAEAGLNEPDLRRLGQFFQFGYIGEPDTIYRHIHRLPAGHYGVWERGQFVTHPYWSVQFEPDPLPSDADWAEQLDAALAKAVRVRLQSEVTLGVFLSGGLDSSAVVAYAHAAGLNPLKTFTIGFDRDEWDESDDALRVAKHFDTEHHVLRIREADLCDRFAETLQAMTHHCDEPFGDDSALPTYHVSRLARDHVTVILSGDGADELFAGYSSYRGVLFAQRYRRYLPYWLGRHVLPAMPRAAAAVLPGRLHYQALRTAKVLQDSALPIPQAYRDKTSIWTPQQLRRLLVPDVLQQADYLDEQYMPDALWQTFCSGRDIISRLTEIDLLSYMRDDILVKVDRMSMAHSLEVRSPFLDHHLVELAARMPSRIKLRGSTGKVVLRDVLRLRLPPQTMKKRKHGFSVPLRDWFRGRLRDLVHDYLGSGSRLPASIISPAAVQSMLREHDRGTLDHSRRIWLLLAFATWHEQYQSGRVFAAPSGRVAPRGRSCEC